MVYHRLGACFFPVLGGVAPAARKGGISVAQIWLPDCKVPFSRTA